MSLYPVVNVRATALADELRRAKTLTFIASFNPKSKPTRRSPFWLDAEELQWAADRLLSACEKALGTRGRHYD